MSEPNIILINCDDLGYGDLGCYGSTVNSTPAIDKLAEAGIKFTNFYMASPLCTPSRGGMLTGCYPPRINFGSFGEEKIRNLFPGREEKEKAWVLFPGMAEGLNPEEYTLGQLFKDNGYATKIIGKWHCGDQPEFLPNNFGFDSYYGLPYSNDMGRQVGRTENPPLPLLWDKEVIQQQPDQTSLTERYLEEAVKFVRQNKELPFFLYFAHMYVHLPLYVPEWFLKNSKNGPYGAAVECIDWFTAVLMKELEELGIESNTIVIFTSDNGSRVQGEGGSNGSLRGIKGDTWEGGMRLPFIIRWPEKIKAGQICNGLATSMDLLPSLAAIIGRDLPGDNVIDGMDLHSMFFDASVESLRNTFFYYKMDMLEAVRHNKWKLHVSKDRNPIQELYDLENDPGEQTNIYDSFPDIVKELEKLLEQCRTDIGDSLRGIDGKNRRPCGKVDNPKPLTCYEDSYPYFIAEYDLPGWG